MDSLCPLADSSTDTTHDHLTLGAILRAFLPALLPSAQAGQAQTAGALAPCRLWYTGNWAPIFSLVPTARIDIGHRAPAETGIVRVAWPPKAGSG